MSKRKEFEEFCRRTRPPMCTQRDVYPGGSGNYSSSVTRGAWQAWQYLDKQYNPWPKGCKAADK